METTERRRPGRPADTVHGTMSARHPSGAAIGWSDGHWAGDPALVAAARQMCADRVLLPVGETGAWVITETGSPVAAYAILLNLCGPDVRGDHPVHALIWLSNLAIADPDADWDVEDDEDDDV